MQLIEFLVSKQQFKFNTGGTLTCREIMHRNVLDKNDQKAQLLLQVEILPRKTD